MIESAKRWFLKVAAWLDELRHQENQLAMVLSLVIGAVVGLVVVVFIKVTSGLTTSFFPENGSEWRRVLVPVLGALGSGYLLYRFFPAARGSGVPQTKAAIYIRDGRIRFHTVIGKFLCCSVSLASGIALGREGPSVQIGAGIASLFGRRLKMSTEQLKALIPVGGAAALAAAFNTPIAAVLFSLEEIVGDLHAPVLGSVVLSSATSWIVLHLLLGDEPFFHVAPYHLVSPVELLVYAVLGIAGGVASAAFARLLLSLRARFLAMPSRTAWAHPVVGGLTVGVMGLFLPDVLGVGYPAVDKVLGGVMVFKIVLLLAILKLIATAVCYASGNAGGIFGPSLFIGAMLGGAVGQIAHMIAPAHTATAGAYALVGMGAVFAGVVRTPMTSVIMIFELTRDYSIIVPLMISNLIAFFISQRMQRDSLYDALAQQDGIHLPSGVTRAVSSRFRVAAVMHPTAEIIPPTMPVAEAKARLTAGTGGRLIAGAERLTLLDAATLDAAIGRGEGSLPVAHLLGSEPPTASEQSEHLHADHSLDVALRRMGETGRDVLPVVSRDDVRHLLGAVTLTDVLTSYGVERAIKPDT
ncbi:MAG: chloride channel protein [Gemmatimonadales bacterium]